MCETVDTEYLGLGEVADPPVHAALEEVDLGEDHLVVEPLQLGQKSIDE
jgi:hypothetical protein